MSFNQRLNCLSLEKKILKILFSLARRNLLFARLKHRNLQLSLQGKTSNLQKWFCCCCAPTFDTRSLSVLVAYEKLPQQPSKMAAKLLNLCNAERLLLPHLLVLIHATTSGWMHFPWGSSSGSVPHGERLSGRDNAVCIVPPDLLPHKAGLLTVCNS